MLNVVDASGSSGGIPGTIFTVVAASPDDSTACVVTPSSSSFTVTANVTDTLTTCSPWGLQIQGGVPPYNLTLIALNSPDVTNVTLPQGTNEYTYIDRANPNSQLLAAVSDSTGQWATGTPAVNTQGKEIF